jgi:hypothetical protein
MDNYNKLINESFNLLESLDKLNEVVVRGQTTDPKHAQNIEKHLKRKEFASEKGAKMQGNKARKKLEELEKRLREQGKSTEDIAREIAKLHTTSPMAKAEADKRLKEAKSGEGGLIEKYDGTDPNSMHPDMLYRMANPKSNQIPFMIIGGKLFYIAKNNTYEQDEHNMYDGLDVSFSFTHSGIVQGLIANALDTEDPYSYKGINFDDMLDGINYPDDKGFILGRYYDNIVSFWNSNVNESKAQNIVEQLSKRLKLNVTKIFIPEKPIDRVELGARIRSMLNKENNLLDTVKDTEGKTVRYEDPTEVYKKEEIEIDNLLEEIKKYSPPIKGAFYYSPLRK